MKISKLKNKTLWLIIAAILILGTLNYTREGFSSETLLPVGWLMNVKLSDKPPFGQVVANGFSKIINAKSGAVVFDGITPTTLSQYTTPDYYICVGTPGFIKDVKYSTTPLSLADAATFHNSQKFNSELIGIVFTNSSGAYVDYKNTPIATAVDNIKNWPMQVGIIIGVVILVLVLIVIIYFMFRSKRKNIGNGSGNTGNGSGNTRTALNNS